MASLLQFRVVRDQRNGSNEPVGVYYVMSSLTPYKNHNPSECLETGCVCISLNAVPLMPMGLPASLLPISAIRRYIYNKTNFEIVDIETYWTDLGKDIKDVRFLCSFLLLCVTQVFSRELWWNNCIWLGHHHLGAGIPNQRPVQLGRPLTSIVGRSCGPLPGR